MRWLPNDAAYRIVLTSVLVSICAVVALGYWHKTRLWQLHRQLGAARSAVHENLGPPVHRFATRRELAAFSPGRALRCVALNERVAEQHNWLYYAKTRQYRLEEGAPDSLPACSGPTWDGYRVGPSDLGLLCYGSAETVEQAYFCEF